MAHSEYVIDNVCWVVSDAAEVVGIDRAEAPDYWSETLEK